MEKEQVKMSSLFLYSSLAVKFYKEQVIIIKKCSQPNSEVMAIYQATKYKQMPFSLKKYVVPQ